MYKNQDDYVWIFNPNEFKNKDIVINCESEDEAKQLFEIFINNSITSWGMGDNLSVDETCWVDSSCVYEYDSGLYVEDIYKCTEYKIYKFSEIDFSQSWNKESIEKASLNKPFDITQLKSVTLNELLANREFKTGDIVSDTESIGIVLGDRVSYINTPCQEKLNPKTYCEFIPVELIESNVYLTKSLSDYMYYKNYNCLKQYFVQLLDESNKKKIISVEFVVGSDKPKDFILETNLDEIKAGDIVEVFTGATYQYARVKEIKQETISQRELENYKTCRKLS